VPWSIARRSAGVVIVCRRESGRPISSPMFKTMRSTMRSTVPVKEEFGYNRELTSLNLFVGEPENCDAPNALEPNVHASVMGRVTIHRVWTRLAGCRRFPSVRVGSTGEPRNAL
jgi:hypothetical protein